MTGQLVDVDAGPAVDVGRELVRQDERAHALRLPGRSSATSRPRRRAVAAKDALDLVEVERLGDDRGPRADLGLAHGVAPRCTPAAARPARRRSSRSSRARSPPRPSGRSSSRISEVRHELDHRAARDSAAAMKPERCQPASRATSRSSSSVGASSSTTNMTGHVLGRLSRGRPTPSASPVLHASHDDSNPRLLMAQHAAQSVPGCAIRSRKR